MLSGLFKAGLDAITTVINMMGGPFANGTYLRETVHTATRTPNVARSAGAIRIAFDTRACGSSPRLQRL